jgi:hypothetical protein
MWSFPDEVAHLAALEERVSRALQRRYGARDGVD